MNNNNEKSCFRLTLLDKVNVCLQTLGDHVMHLVFTPAEPLDLLRFRRALRLSLDAEPILACRLVPGLWAPRWRRWDAGELDAFEFCEILAEDNREQQIQDFLLRTMNCSQEPMVRARLIRGNADTLCLNVSCVPIDGRGLLIYLERLFDIYNRLGADPGHLPRPADPDQRSTRHLLRYFKLVDIAKVLFFGLRNQWIDSRTAKNWKFPTVQAAVMDRAFHHHQFQPDTLRAMHAYRRRKGFTVNDLMLGAFYHSLQRIIQPQPGTVCCVLNTFDLRRYEPADAVDRVANYSSFVNSNVRLDAGLSFEELVRRVKTAMAERKRHYAGITEGPFIWPVLNLLPFAWANAVLEKLLRHRGEDIPVLTNVGIIDSGKLLLDGRPLVDLVPYAPLEFPPKLTVTLATVGELITLSVGYSRHHFKPVDVEYLFVEMEKVIQRTCAAENGVTQGGRDIPESASAVAAG